MSVSQDISFFTMMGKILYALRTNDTSSILLDIIYMEKDNLMLDNVDMNSISTQGRHQTFLFH